MAIQRTRGIELVKYADEDYGKRMKEIKERESYIIEMIARNKMDNLELLNRAEIALNELRHVFRVLDLSLTKPEHIEVTGEIKSKSNDKTLGIHADNLCGWLLGIIWKARKQVEGTIGGLKGFPFSTKELE